ncbi:LXG domain-containing protein [Rossellomorea marisflavi]|uniref:LXG domain-containing protein n=1 Tax=Rossellomorea marisflavi TaxID=189381 RepID=UPI0025B11189|nr:LXG domain-containing protein [Rossellomorea marisflavi]WJV17997.1 LXG domain-containing protein [Rossellomorea marisflavi]
MKVLDASALHEGIEKQSSKFKEQQESIEKLKSEIDNLVNLNDAFKGEAGDSIRAFYKDYHGKFLTYYTSTLENYVKVLKNVKEATTELESDPSGYISESFLSNDLTNGLDNGRNLTVGLVNDANSSISSVNDILHAPTIQDDRFLSYHQQAQKEITDTVEKLNKYDSTQSKSFDSVEEDIQLMERVIDDIGERFNNGSLEVRNYNYKDLLKSKDYKELATNQIQRQASEVVNKILSPLDTINEGLGWGDNLLLGYHTLSIMSTSLFASKIKVNYFKGKPSLWNKLKGNYEFSIKMDDSWTSKSKHSSKIAKKILDFKRAPSPSNPLLKMAHKFVDSYNSPSDLYKNVAGFPKNSNRIKGSDLLKSIKNRVETSTKDLADLAAKSSKFTRVAKTVPVVGNIVSFTSNLSEFTSEENANKGMAEKTGRFIGGTLTDAVAVGTGVKIGATIGSIGGPVGIVVGGAVGGLVGGIVSSKYGDKIKDFTGDVAKKSWDKVKNSKAAKKVGKLKDSVVSWFK